MALPRTLLARTLERNPGLVEAAIHLHQNGIIPAGTFLLDVDAVAHNARLLADEALRCNLRTYVMTKSYGRNPLVTATALAQGLDSTVASEAREAHLIHRFGLPVGHVGHLGAIPLHEVTPIVSLNPEAITVFSFEAARAISKAAGAMNRDQRIYVRINRPGDEVFRGFVGGWTDDECVEGLRPMLKLPNVTIAGLTTYPSISYATTDIANLKLSDAFFTILRAKATLERELGLVDLRVNAPANNSVSTFRLLADYGVTDAEPGHALLGGSLLHALHDLPEKPAQVYVSEVTHRWAGELYTLGGGMLYIEAYGGAHDAPEECLVGSTFEQARERTTTMLYRGHVDYYAVCEDIPSAQVGDTAIYALHPQYFVNRAYVAAVSGVASNRPRLECLFDWACNPLDESLQPIPLTTMRSCVSQILNLNRSGRVSGSAS